MKIIIILLLIFYISPSHANDRDMDKFTHVAGINLSDYSELEVITKKLGKTEIVRTGDAADYLGKICYLTKQRNAVLEFNEGELYQGYVIHFPNKSDTKCSVLKKLEINNLSVAGISLGMSRKDFDKIIQNSHKDNNTVVKEYSYTETEDNQKWRVYIDIKATFFNTRLHLFSVSLSAGDTD